jgi:ABC-2 type transport system ATP-binding protein
MSTDMTENQFAIETVALTKIFPDWWGRQRVIAVDNLNLQIRTGEIYGFLGPNGSGKTTTIKMMLNLLHPTRGGATVLGGDSADAAISSRIGYLPEESYLYRYLTAYETLDFYGRLFGLPGSVRKERIETLLDMVGLSGAGNRQVGTFSKGMARRIGLAQALINDPDLLILDEPTSGMDPMGTRQIKDLLVELGKRGKTILLCSHLLAEVEDICDRIGIMYGGKMQVEGSVKNLLELTGKTQIQTSHLNENSLVKIQTLLRQENCEFEITHPMDRLETLFVRTVNKAQQEQQATSGVQAGSGISGFLAEREIVRQPGILDKLVAGQAETQIDKIRGDTETVAVTPQKAEPQQDAELLRKLATAKTDPIAETLKPQQAKSVEAVKIDILSRLVGKDKNADGSTTPTDSKAAGE